MVALVKLRDERVNQVADHDQIPLAMVAALVKLRDQGLNQVAHHDHHSVSPATAYVSSALAHSPASCSYFRKPKSYDMHT